MSPRKASLELVATLPGLPSLTTGLGKLTQQLGDWTPFWVQSFAPLFYETELQIFASGGAGRMWHEYSPLYARWRARRGRPTIPTLVLSGALKRSLTSQHAAGSVFLPSRTSLIIGSAIPYARAHFTGTPPQSRGPKSLPKRREIRMPRLSVLAPQIRKLVRDAAKAATLPGVEVQP